MIKKISCSVLLIFVFILVMACNQSKKEPFHWQTTNSTFDSISRDLEYIYLGCNSKDSIWRSIRELSLIRNTISDDIQPLMDARIYYWKARYEKRYGSHELATKYAQSALDLVDSLHNTYDWMRISLLMTDLDLQTDLYSRYLRLDNITKYAQSIKDDGLESIVLVSMGNLLSDIGENDRALEYYEKSDSLMSNIGLELPVIRNQINIAQIYKNMGKVEISDSILTDLEKHPLLVDDTLAMNTIWRNLYSNHQQGKFYLNRAYNQIKSNPRYLYLRGLYNALMAKENAMEGNSDSVQIYANHAIADLPYVNDYGHKAIIWWSKAIAWECINRHDSALFCTLKKEDYLDSLNIRSRVTEIVRLKAVKDLQAERLNHEWTIYRYRFVTVMITLVVLLIGLTVALILNRRYLKQRVNTLSQYLELEKAKRKIAATTLTLEQKNTVLGTLRDELSTLRKEGKIKDGSARKLEASIKSNLSTQDEDEAFRNMFDVINPGFTERLRQHCPGIADSYIKLATYLLMEMDNKKIASLMRIKPESVHQARWRLKQRLNVPEGTSLEDFLRELNKITP